MEEGRCQACGQQLPQDCRLCGAEAVLVCGHWSLGINTDLNVTNRTRVFRTLRNLGDHLAQLLLRRKQEGGVKWVAQLQTYIWNPGNPGHPRQPRLILESLCHYFNYRTSRETLPAC